MSGYDFLYDGGRFPSTSHPAYRPPVRFEHAVPAVVGYFSAGDAEEGVGVIVSEVRRPAAFMTLNVGPRPDGLAFTLAFGSDQGDLAFAIAEALARGMLTISLSVPHDVVTSGALRGVAVDVLPSVATCSHVWRYPDTGRCRACGAVVEVLS